MRKVILSQFAGFAILQPLLANLITAHVKVPNFRRYALEVLLAIDLGVEEMLEQTPGSPDSE